MADNETTADIIAEIRAVSNSISDGIIAINGRSIADRLEAAIKRERAKIEADALAVGGVVEAARKRESGDCAKLREALEHCRNCAQMIPQFVQASKPERSSLNAAAGYANLILRDVAAALSAPPRNCDRFATVDEARKAYEEYRKDYIMRASNKFDFPMEFEAWLFAPATEKEGGAK